jgi:hypothetical protein
MSPTMAHEGYARKTQESQYSVPLSWEELRNRASRLISTENVVSFVLASVLTVWGGWVLWELSRAIENSRVF